MDILHSIEGEGNGRIPALPLDDAKFSKFFKWLSSSMDTVVGSGGGNDGDWIEILYKPYEI